VQVDTVAFSIIDGSNIPNLGGDMGFILYNCAASFANPAKHDI
jgi:hypothetical protein